MSKKVKSTSGKRNPLALNPLMKKSHAHGSSDKARRAKEKQALKKQLRESSGDA